MITIRRFDPEDQQSVVSLITQIMQEEFWDDRVAYPTQDIANIPTSYSGIGEAFFVAVRGDRIVGTVAIKKEDGRIALLRRLFVAKDCRNQQIGVKLVDRALHFCDELGYEEVVFKTTSKMQAAAKTCQKKGFIQRAKIQLGNIELLKYVVCLRNGHKISTKR